MNKTRTVLIIVTLLIIFGSIYAASHTIFSSNDKTKVPDVIGKQFTEAADIIHKVGLRAKIEKIDSEAQENSVVTQSVPSGEVIKAGKSILLQVSKGGNRAKIPDVRHMKREEALKILGEAGFRVEKTIRVIDPERNFDAVIAQNPSAGQKITFNIPVTLLVSGGNSADEAQIEIPELIGKRETEAVKALAEAGLKTGNISKQISASEAGTVLSTSPSAGTKLPASASVSLVIAVKEETNPAVATKESAKKTESKKVEIKKEKKTEPKKPEAKKESPTPQKVETKAETKKSESAKKSAEIKQPSRSETKAESKTEIKAKQEPKTEPKAEKKAETKSVQTSVEKLIVKEEPKQADSTKSSRIYYITPPITTPMSFKIVVTDVNGKRTIKDTTVKANEKVSVNVSYAGKGKAEILLGGKTVWTEQLN